MEPLTLTPGDMFRIFSLGAEKGMRKIMYVDREVITPMGGLVRKSYSCFLPILTCTYTGLLRLKYDSGEREQNPLMGEKDPSTEGLFEIKNKAEGDFDSTMIKKGEHTPAVLGFLETSLELLDKAKITADERAIMIGRINKVLGRE